jgi:hypothetical protein
MGFHIPQIGPPGTSQTTHTMRLHYRVGLLQRPHPRSRLLMSQSSLPSIVHHLQKTKVVVDPSFTLLFSLRAILSSHTPLFNGLSSRRQRSNNPFINTQQIARRTDDRKPCDIHNLEILILTYENALPNIWYDGGRLVHWRCHGWSCTCSSPQKNT